MTVFGVAFALQSLVVLAISIVAVVALQLFLSGTRTGRCMQATAQNPAVARLLGIQDDDEARRVTAAFAWARGGTGRLVLEHERGAIARLVVIFDER